MRHGINAFGLSLLAALCLTAVAAPGAQGSEFLTSEGTFKELGVQTETVTGQPAGNFELLLLGLDIILKGDNSAVLAASVNALGFGSGEILFSECQYYDHAGASAGCQPFHMSVDIAALVFLHGHAQHPYVLFEPAGGGTVFASVVPEGCLVPPAEVEGSAVAEITNNPLGHVEKPRMAINLGTPSLFPEHALFYGENEAHLSAEAEGWLTGALEGEDWDCLETRC